MLSNAFLDELRARTSLSGLIGRTTKLQKAGAEFKAPCPFHNEKTPSFYVNDAKGFYHCFGCGAHGDAIRWLTEQRGLPFMDAVRELADAAGMELPTPDPATRERVERAAGLHDVTQGAAEWYAAQLRGPAGAAARAYLDGRGIDAATVAEFGLGYAPGGRRALAEALGRFDAPMLVEAGMLIAPDGGGEPYDRFRDRLMIPIADARGRTIAFGGRVLGAGEPKYLNSPETPLFDKGAALWNLHRAGPASRKSGRLIVVEGYLDAIALAQAGIREAVAPLGTALTERQMEQAWRLVDVPLVCLDGDAAGVKAAARAATRALAVLRPGKSLAFATLPAGQDPDDLVRRGGAAAFEAAVADPVPLVRLLYDHERAQGDMAQPEQRAGLRARLDALAEGCADRIVAQEYRRSFNDLFFEDFGWKRGERKSFASAMLHALPTTPGDLGHQYVRSVVYGIGRYPEVVAECADELSRIHVLDGRLAKCRDLIVRKSWEGRDFDDCIAQILDANGYAAVMEHDITRDLRFAFARSALPRERHVEALKELIRHLAAEAELDEGLSGLDMAARAAVELADPALAEAEYLAITAERQYLWSHRAALADRAYAVGRHEQDHGTGDGEDEHGGDGREAG